jgi:molybdopterin-guanine dinucleotide biosynthesis protein A
MRQPKHLAPFRGKTFLDRVLAAIDGRVARITLLGDARLPPTAATIDRLSDAPGLKGPLAGILAALRSDRAACWLIAACDLPLIRGEAIDWLLGQRGPTRSAVLPRVAPDRVEPLLAVYEPESLALLEELVARGADAPRCLVGDPTVYTPTPPAALQVCWTNVNTPDELRRLGRPGVKRAPPQGP